MHGCNRAFMSNARIFFIMVGFVQMNMLRNEPMPRPIVDLVLCVLI